MLVNKILPCLLLPSGLIGNLWFLTIIRVSARMRDNLCSRYITFMISFDLIRSTSQSIRLFALSVTGGDILNSHSRVCMFSVIFMHGMQLSYEVLLCMMTFVRAVHMFRPKCLVGLRSSVNHISVFTLVMSFVYVFVIILMNEDDPNRPDWFSYVTSKDEMNGYYNVQLGTPRRCFAYMQHYVEFSLGLISCTWVSQFAIVLMSIFHTKLPDYHGKLYRHYRGLTCVILLQGINFSFLQLLPHSVILLSQQTKTLTIPEVQAVEYLELTRMSIQHWVLMTLSNTYRHEALYSAWHFFKKKAPPNERITSYSDIMELEVDPQQLSDESDAG